MIQAFTKVEGLGNDFALLDARAEAVTLDPQRAVALCDRHRGIGADGVLLIGPSKKAAARLEIWNADGSRAEMCGNGLRCAALLLLGELKTAELIIETAAGLHRCRLAGGPGSWSGSQSGSFGEVWVELVGLDVGRSETLEVPGPRGEPISLSGRRVGLGNPHFVLFGGADTNRAAQLGPAIEQHRAFSPGRTNVEFCELPSQPGTATPAPALRVRVWERGAGLTQACGTGAAAAAAAAWADGHLPRERTLVELPGGTVSIDPVSKTSVGLTGAARVVFRGEIEI
jgi:diaminopimelate epimerase